MATNLETDWLGWHSSPEEGAAPGRAPVQVWACDLEDAALDRFCDESTLSDDEREHALRLRFPRGRRLFLRRRALKRFLLGRFLGVAAAELRFVENGLDKPRLAAPYEGRVHYSGSDSESLYLLALSTVGVVGVDVEAPGPGWDWEGVAELYLDAPRLAQLRGVPLAEAQEAFLRFWGLHEAFGKATGTGVVGEADDGVSAEAVWDLVFQPARAASSVAAAGWRWETRKARVGNCDVVAATVVRG